MRTILVSPDSSTVYDAVNGRNAVRQMTVSATSLSFAAEYRNYDAGITGLSAPQNLALSPDGACLYVTTEAHTIVAFSRNTTTSNLTYDSQIAQADGLYGGFYNVVVSPDGKHLYAYGDRIEAADRAPTGCGLSSLRRVTGEPLASGNEDIAMSSDGDYLFAVDPYAKQLRVYSRDPGTGSLTPLQTLASPAVGGLDGATGVVVSPDGKNVYVTAAVENSLTTFARDTSSGMLTFQSLLRDGTAGVDGLEAANSLVVARDGKNVYVSSAPENSVATFERSPLTGALVYLQKLTEDYGPPSPPPAPPPAPPACQPPVDDVGVTINDAALYTNDANARLTIKTPRLTTGVRISNDGGFGTAVTRNVQAEPYEWSLASTGPERLPKTVYIRFQSPCVDSSQTFTDDIILDETPPAIAGATLMALRASKSFESSALRGGRGFRLRIRAHDNVSGVARMQITSRKLHPGVWRSFKKTTTFRTTRKAVWVRVRDRARNVSRWRLAHRAH
jgi:6-phosphogluconolactonase (cycloisomerase 2 family)